MSDTPPPPPRDDEPRTVFMPAGGMPEPLLPTSSPPGRTDPPREQTGGLPTTEAFATAIADAAGDRELESGSTVFVGSVS